MIVMKFGGTSVGSAQRIKNLVPLINKGEQKIVVLSAMSGTTNLLVDISVSLYSKDLLKLKQQIDELDQRYKKVIDELFSKKDSIISANELLAEHLNFINLFTLDLFTANEEKAILAQGELLSTALLHLYMIEQNISSVLMPALEFMRIDESEEPEVLFIKKMISKTMEQFGDENLFITQGYICRNSFGEIDNLKRGGSDYTATLIGAAVNAAEIQIWTDIDGLHNNDPRIVEKTFAVTELSFDEAAELAYFGAKILHPTCVLPAKKENIPVRLLNTMQPTATGTIISNKPAPDRITAIAAKDNLTAIKIKSARMLLAYGFLRAVFEVFERYKTPIDMISTSEVAVSLTIDNDKHLEEIIGELEQFGLVEVDKNQTIICIVGTFGADKQGYASRIFDSLKNIPIRMISYGGSENNISLLVNSDLKKKALVSLNKGLF
ncbi:aspartokinase [Bacteroidota bacterium]|nr:aspartokinase [Bacteroidota bacterium]